MNEAEELSLQKYPAIADLLRRYGGITLLEYLRQIRHHPLPDIMPAEDLTEEVRNYFKAFFGEKISKEAAGVISRCRCLSTANHHHLAFEYMTVQDTILYDQWLCMQGETGLAIPFLAASNPNLTNTVYPRGMIIYDCAAPEGHLRIPLYPWKLKRQCIAALEGITLQMADKASGRLHLEVSGGTITSRMGNAMKRFCHDVLMSDHVQQYGTLREQTTVINAMLSQKYFTDRSPRYLWMPLETLASRLLIRDLQSEKDLPYQILFCRELRSLLIQKLDGVPGCWTGNAGGTHFFWGLDSRAILFPLHLADEEGSPVLTGRNSLGEDVKIPFTRRSLIDAFHRHTLLPGLFLCFLEIHFLRDFTVLGGYYQPAYLEQMRKGLVQSLRALKMFEREAQIIELKTDYMTLGLTFLRRSNERGIFPVSTAELLEKPISMAELERAMNISLEDSVDLLKG